MSGHLPECGAESYADHVAALLAQDRQQMEALRGDTDE